MLTVVIITKNEEYQIRKCLNSLKDWADEIILVDDDSTDSTVNIAQKEYGAKIIHNISEGNFDRQRNLGFDAAAGDWILQMDADEIIPVQTAEAIKEAITTPSDYVGYHLKMQFCVFDFPLRYLKQTNALKLFRKNKARYIGRKIHETLHVQGRLGYLNAPILHYNNVSVQSSLEKYNFYTDVEARVYLEQHDTVSLKVLKKEMLLMTVRRFYKHYLKNNGYKDGIHGLVWCLINVIMPLMFWLKVAELALKQNKLAK